MTAHSTLFKAVILNVLLCGISFVPVWSQEKDPPAVPVQMTVTLSGFTGNIPPAITRDQVTVKQNRNRMPIVDWVAARGPHAGLDLFILIDDACEPRLGGQFSDLKSFITAQPATTSVGVGYMRNATVQIAQNFTPDHAQAAQALRLPIASAGAFGSPYLSVIDLMNRWPEHPNRRVVIMVTDGIDRARSSRPRGQWSAFLPDVDRATDVAQRTGTLIYTIYFPGVGHVRRNFWEANNGQMGISRLSDETGAESFFLGIQAPVSFKPYLDQIETDLGNQYLLTFGAQPGRNEGFQSVAVNTDVTGAELVSADSVWVPASNKGE
jgi:hypothetical protein